MIYLDSSALIKRYTEEIGTDLVRSILLTSAAIATSKLTYPEILSVLMRKHRAAEIARRSLTNIIDRFEKDWSHLFVLQFHNDLLPIAKKLISNHPLKAADAIHLSSALWLKHSTKTDVTFVASDSALLKAAQGEGLQTTNPEYTEG
jgi:uncharacterized protein